MAFTALPAKLWLPNWYFGIGDIGSYPPAVVDTTLDVDEKEFQYIGRVQLADGGVGGPRTFGGGSSGIGWLSGASIAFVTTATLRIGIKDSTKIDAAAGPAARATIGAAAFDVWADFTGGGGGINTIASTTWRNDTMTNTDGANVTVNHGDLIAICWHLETTAGTQSVKVRSIGTSSIGMPVCTVVTAGPAYAAASSVPNAILTFSDNSIGWIEGSWPHSVGVTAETIGINNILGNNFKFPFRCKVDAVADHLVTGGTTNFTVGLWSTPNSTPTAMTNGTVSVDPQVLASTAQQMHIHTLPAAVTLEADTEYLVGCLQGGATPIQASYFTVDAYAHLAASGANLTCYHVKSTTGGAVSIPGIRRAGFYVRISEIEATAAAAAAGSKFIG